MTTDDTMWQRLVEIMAAPDPPDLPPRGHRLTQEGKPERFALVSKYACAFDQHLLTAMDDRRVPRPRLS